MLSLTILGKGSVFSVVVPGGVHVTHGRVEGGPYGGPALGIGSGRK